MESATYDSSWCCFQGIALRGLFIIDKEGVIQHSTINNLGIGRSVDETLRTLQVYIGHCIFSFVSTHFSLVYFDLNRGTVLLLTIALGSEI